MVFGSTRQIYRLLKLLKELRSIKRISRHAYGSPLFTAVCSLSIVIIIIIPTLHIYWNEHKSRQPRSKFKMVKTDKCTTVAIAGYKSSRDRHQYSPFYQIDNHYTRRFQPHKRTRTVSYHDNNYDTLLNQPHSLKVKPISVAIANNNSHSCYIYGNPKVTPFVKIKNHCLKRTTNRLNKLTPNSKRLYSLKHIETLQKLSLQKMDSEKKLPTIKQLVAEIDIDFADENISSFHSDSLISTFPMATVYNVIILQQTHQVQSQFKTYNRPRAAISIPISTHKRPISELTLVDDAEQISASSIAEVEFTPRTATIPENENMWFKV